MSSALIAEDNPPGIVYEAAIIAKTTIIRCRSTSGNTNLIINAAA